ncbi:fasciclin domain-containing protein [Sphingomonas sp.]|uniref:fasciclin domain-containing protein n=1 Tax=Sphingomonas sp. TaxID=28214 RepID=UPI0035BC8AE3
MTRYALIGLAGIVALTGCARDTGSTATPPAAAPAPVNPSVGGASMLADRTIAANASAAPTLSTLVAAVKAAGLAETLSGPGPFTVFAPTDAAFARLAPGTVDTLLKPENKPALVKVLTYHVVSGTLTAADLTARITAGGGTATLMSVEGDPLTLTLTEGHLTLTDVGGNKSYVEIGDVRQSNGIVHVVNGVLVPKLG